MAIDKKISELANGAPAEAGDEYVVARSGANYKLTLTNIAASMPPIGATTPNTGAFTTISGTTGNITTVNATTVDATNVEVTNVKAKDGTAAITIADSTGLVTAGAGVTLSGGNLNFSSTAQRITGDMANSTHANRLLFQNSGANLPTIVGALPNGTSVTTGFVAYGGSTASDTSTSSFVTNGGTDTRISSSILGTGTYLPMTFYTGGSERVRIDTSGNVGIGSASINTFFNKTLLIGGGSSVSLNFRTTNTGTANSDGTDIGILNTGTSDFFIVQREAANVIFEVNGAERMRIDSSGNVGIGGTAGADTRLAILGTLPTSGTLTKGINVTGTIPSSSTGNNDMFRSSPTTEAASFTTSSIRHFFVQPATFGAGSTVTNQYGFVVGAATTGATNNYGFYSDIASGSNRWNFYAGGTALNYFAGNTYVGNSAPAQTARLVAESTSGPAARFFLDAASTTGTHCLVVDKYDNDSTTSNVFVAFTINDQATTSGQINANGANQAAFGTYSDVRLKENIVNLPPQLANICALRPVEFDYKTGGHQIGFIAQEMQEVYADAVGESADGMLTVTGWSKTEARLVKAIQELTARVAELEAK